MATAALVPQPESLGKILATAGGGGGGQGFASSTRCIENPGDPNQDFVDVSCAGGDGGVAIGIDVQNRFGFGRMGATLPVSNFIASGSIRWAILNVGAGDWVAGAGGFAPGGGGHGGASSTAFSFAGAPGAGSSGTWVRETTALTLGSAAVLGGGHGGAGSTAFSFAGAPGAGSSGTWVRETTALTLGSAAVLGGGGGGGVAGGGGAGNAVGGGGASNAVGSGYGLAEGEALNVPCQAEGFCARNWLSSADTDQPKVVITFWQNQGADPLIPTDHETIDTDQPSLVFKGTGASSGIHYLLEDPFGEIVNYSGLVNGSATGNLLWTVPSGLLGEGQAYDWYVTDQSGKTLQAPQSFTIATDTTPSGLSQGWTLYVRSMDDLDTSLPADLQPLDNQLVPKVSSSCTCDCATDAGSRYFCESLFWASQPKQAAKT
ncbi:MAG: hypothetical protein A6F70_09920 [Cycloclasticus sp. symbiont of Bathymodiolus heckerae]|nr:MAG: hypothetical protein A6F70_09920 [Cycloclasticus sp. symbiont of Bathymodiolus heckerae]